MGAALRNNTSQERASEEPTATTIKRMRERRVGL
jgi:hypothetical protein